MSAADDDQIATGEANPADAADGDVIASRRGMMALVGAAVAYAGLGATKASATANLTVNTASTNEYGILASTAASGTPITPTLGATTHSIIGSQSSLAVATVDSGVFGARSGTGRAGVLGVNGADGAGVMGASASATGVYGESPSATGVYGKSTSSFGVVGESTSGNGVRGLSSSGTGLVGESTSAFGLIARSASTTRPALYAASTAASPYAGFFAGRVRIQGSFSVTGAKAAAVELPDGSLVTMYSQESPEPWFEDFGRARLVDGHVRVSLDPRFASLVKLEGYMVFCHPEGDTEGLFVAARDDDGFDVREAKGGRGNFEFAYRIVARRKDIPGERLALIDPMDHLPPEPQHLAAAGSPEDWLRHIPGSLEV